MEDFILYIGKAALALGAFYLAYLALFQHQKHFLFNRIYLPVSFLVSFLIPLITFTKVNYIQSVPVTASESFAYLPEAAVANEPPFTFEWYHYLLAIYVLGIVVFFLNLLIGHLKAMNIIRFSRLKELFGAQVNLTQKDVHPFSFFSRIVLSEKMLKNPDLKMIVDHEMVHVREHHTLDILFAELLFLFQWFNPFAWLTRDAMRNNLEYLTDHQVAQNHNAEAYQLAMVGLAHKKGVAPFLTALNGSQLKNRIIMMKKKTENRYSLLKQLVVLPLLAVLVMGLSNKEVRTEVNFKESPVLELTVKGKITNDKGEPVPGVAVLIEGTTIGTISDFSGDYSLKITNENAVLVFNMLGYELRKVPANKEQINVVLTKSDIDSQQSPNGVVVKPEHAVTGKITNEDGEGIPAVAVLVKGTTVGTVSDFSGNYKIETNEKNTLVFKMIGYAEKEVAIDGKSELDVRLKADGSGKPEDVEVKPAKTQHSVIGKITNGKGEAIPAVAVLVRGTTVGTVSDLSGNYKIGTGENNTLVFKMIGYAEKEVPIDGKTELNVQLKADGSGKTDDVKAFGFGEQDEESFPKIEIEKLGFETSPPEKAPLYYVDGKEMGNVANLSAEDIKNISVLKGKQAEILYGEKGKNGVIIITTKNAAKEELSKALVIVDGISYDGDINDIDPNTIASMEVLKDENATKIYGPIAKNGAISIKLKGSADLNGKSPLIFLNGVKYTGDMKDIDPDNIASIDVLKDASAIETYGEGAKDGVILVTTKSEEITSELDLRKYIAKNIKYPTKAVEKGSQGTVQAFVDFDKNNLVVLVNSYVEEEHKVKRIEGYKKSDIVYLDDVVAVAYAENEINQAAGEKQVIPELALEVKRIIEQLPKVDIERFKGKAVGISVTFMLQE